MRRNAKANRRSSSKIIHLLFPHSQRLVDQQELVLVELRSEEERLVPELVLAFSISSRDRMRMK